jgi:hypothetical protein
LPCQSRVNKGLHVAATDRCNIHAPMYTENDPPAQGENIFS